MGREQCYKHQPCLAQFMLQLRGRQGPGAQCLLGYDSLSKQHFMKVSTLEFLCLMGVTCLKCVAFRKVLFIACYLFASKLN